MMFGAVLLMTGVTIAALSAEGVSLAAAAEPDAWSTENEDQFEATSMDLLHEGLAALALCCMSTLEQFPS